MSVSGSARSGALAVLVMTLAGCSDVNGPSPGGGEGLLVLSVAGRTPGAGPAAAPETITLGGDVLVLEQVELVLREIELERVGEDDSCRGGENEGDDDACEEVELGPLLIDLPLGGGTMRRLQVAVEAGAYEEVEFEVHKPDDDEAKDLAFLAAHPDFDHVSIRVRGTFNGVPFVFVTDLNAEQEIDLSPPLMVAAGASAELTLIVDVRTWFLAAGGSRLVNPLTALKGQPNEGLVKENIKRSIDAECEDDGDD